MKTGHRFTTSYYYEHVIIYNKNRNKIEWDTLKECCLGIIVYNL